MSNMEHVSRDVKSGMTRIHKRSRRSKRILGKLGPQLHESSKRLLVLRGTRASESIQQILADLRDIKKPDVACIHSISRASKETFHPFENASSGEFLCEKNNCAFFCLGSSSKKRPMRLAFGRVFANKLLDLFELQVMHYTPSAAFRGVEKPRVGSKPLVLLQGAVFEANEVFRGLRNILADVFRGGFSTDAPSLAASSSAAQQRLFLAGIDRVIAITALDLPNGCDTVSCAVRGKIPQLLNNLRQQSFTIKSNSNEPANVDVEVCAEDFACYESCKNSPLNDTAEDSKKNCLDAVPSQSAAGSDAMICLRQYRILMKQSSTGSKGPHVELQEVGPQLNMRLDRYRLAAPDVWKQATKRREAASAADRKKRGASQVESSGLQPSVTKMSKPLHKQKNVRTTASGDMVGRVFVDKPDWRSLKAQKSVLLLKHNRKKARFIAGEEVSVGKSSCSRNSGAEAMT